MSTTIKQIAKNLGIGYATVSRALNNHGYVKKETKEKILKRAAELNYRPNNIARSLVLGKTKNIGFIASELTNPFFSPVIKAIEETITPKGYLLIIGDTEWSPKIETDYVGTFLENRVEGMIITPLQTTNKHIIELKKSKTPFVLLDKCIGGIKTDFVNFDNVKGAYNAVNYLISLGHKRIAYISYGKLKGLPSYYRYTGYRKALTDAGIKIDRNLVYETERVESEIEYGYMATKELIKYKPTVIFAFDDMVAIGCFKSLKELGIKVPEDMSLLGVDDIEMAQYLEVPLTTLKSPCYELGKRATEILFNRIEGNGKRGYYEEYISPELVIRNSCAPRRHQEGD